MATPRRSARIAALAAATPATAAATAPAVTQQPLRRSARLAAKQNPDRWANPIYSGLLPSVCAKLDADNMFIHDHLAKTAAATDISRKATLIIDLFQYLYTNDLLLLRCSKFRAAVMNKLEGIHGDPWVKANTTATQRRTIAALYKLFTERYKENESHPLYLA
jgi:hypothetical protein